ncbi:hypothetical protein HID58_069765 [Brassica napus]|uniref:Uncharacterized protein n=1 Tax=Brassica napus TaxID=3708 RepID=A0ABQ7YWY3_BRANA|nr:hypothetical protein HID58_069765 [Brassica napus]
MTALFPSSTKESLCHVMFVASLLTLLGILFTLANFVATSSIKNVSICLVLLRSPVAHTITE